MTIVANPFFEKPILKSPYASFQYLEQAVPELGENLCGERMNAHVL